MWNAFTEHKWHLFYTDDDRNYLNIYDETYGKLGETWGRIEREVIYSSKWLASFTLDDTLFLRGDLFIVLGKNKWSNYL